MKKLFSLFSMLILLSSNALSAFTYADSWDNELAMEILLNTLQDMGNDLWVSLVQNPLEQNEQINTLTFEPEWDEIIVTITWDDEVKNTFHYKEIKVWDYVIMDRNLWALTTWWWNSWNISSSYWYYYQWWNNWWFSLNYNKTSSSITDLTDNSSYTSSDWNTNVILNANAWWDTTNTFIARKWPCPDWWHVPSSAEWQDIYEVWLNSDERSYSEANVWKNFYKDLLLPNWWYKGSFSWNPVSSYLTHDAWWLWASTQYNASNWYMMSIGNPTPSISYNWKTYWWNVRCFKNIKTIKYNPNWWAFSGMQINETKNYTYQYDWGNLIPIYNIQIPDRASDNINQQSWWMFAGWYTTASNQTTEFDPATSTTDIAYAKWLPFNDLSIIMSWLEFIIMDRNMWALDYSTWYSYGNAQSNNNRKWFYYQWWNNYWFTNWVLPKKSTTQLNLNDIYWPNNYFYNTLYIYSNPNRSNTVQWNMRWWENARETLDGNRKWPCPMWYHIPTIMEWEKVLELYNTRSHTTGWQAYCNSITNSNDQYCLPAKLKLPFAGYHGYYWDVGLSQWSYWYYWASTHNSDSTSYHFQFYNNKIWTWTTSLQMWSSLRCFKDDNFKNINLVTNWWTNIDKNYKTPRWWEDAEMLPTSETMIRENSIFNWWYTWNNFNKLNDITTTNIDANDDIITLYAKWECESWTSMSDDLMSCNPNIGILKSNDGKWLEKNIERYVTNNTFNNNWYEFIGWNTQSDWMWTGYKSWDIINESWLILYAQWKALEEKAQETATESVVYTNTTTVTVWNEVTEETLSWSSTLTLVAKEVESNEVKKEEDTTKVQESEIKVTSDKTVEYEWWLEVYLEKTEEIWTEVKTGKVEWTIKFSAPVAVKIPISSDAEYVKIQVKHWDEDFGFKWLTLNPVNECNNWEALNDKYNWEDVLVTWNANKYATIYTCSASTFVAYTENKKPVEPTPSAWGGRTITSTKQETKITEQEHNSADTVKSETTQTPNQSVNTPVIEEQVKKIEWRSLTRWEIAVMTNILLDVYPKLTDNRELNEVSEACENYADELNFTKDEKKAITRLCKLSIMWIHSDDNRPLEEFLVNNGSTNDEFSKVINRSLSTYTEKDFSVVKDALKKLEWDEENVVFWTVYDVFMSIKNIFSK